MEEQVFEIDPKQYKEFKKLVLKKFLTMMFTVFTITSLTISWGSGYGIVGGLIFCISCLLLISIVILFTMRKTLEGATKTTYILDDSGITISGIYIPSITIPWEVMHLKFTKSGILIIKNTTTNIIQQKIFKQGLIYIYPQVLDFDKLVDIAKKNSRRTI